MADDSPDQTTPAEKKPLDLSSLSSISLGPDWVSGNKPRARLPKESYEDRDHTRPARGPRKDRRGSLPPRRDQGDRPPRDRGDRGERPHRPRHEQGERPHRSGHFDREQPAAPFQPVVAVDFYPEEEPFKVLAQAIRTSCRTFELFEIARLILDKQDRFVCVVRDPSQKEGEPAKLFASVPDGLPFRSEEEALAHTFRHYLTDFFTIETVEGQPPHGSFQMVHKCGLTGELLAPPNYHRYQAICREHHASKLSHIPYSRFEQRIESSREEDDIQAWLTKMKTQTRYISKENPELVLESLEDARLFLLTQARDKLVRPAYSARFSGKALALLNPQDPIRKSVEYLHEGQTRFPLETANHLRGRLRRMHFAVYKRGSKGISFVCAVKRRFRKPEEVMDDNLLHLIQFIEDHPNFPAKDLPKAYLGVDTEKKAKAAAATAAEAEAARTSGDSPAEPAAEAAAETPPPVAPVLTAEEQASIRDLKNDLHYLVSQGYVIEYSDGRLFVPPIREDEIRHHEKELAEQAKAEEAAEEPDSQPAETPVAEKAAEAAAEKTDVPPAGPVAEATVEPVAEELAEEPVAEAPAAEPVAEEPVEPVAEAVPEKKPAQPES